MRGRCGKRDKRFDSTQTWRTNRQRELLYELCCPIGIAFQLETQDTAKPVKQFSRASVCRGGVKARIENRVYRGMSLQRLRNGKCAFVLKSDTKCEGLHAAVEEVSGMGVERSAEKIETVLDALHKVVASDHSARDNVGMAI